MITYIDFETIYPIWRNFLWPERQSKIEPTSAMCFLGGYDSNNLNYKPTYFAYYIDNQIVGVNSGHMCHDNSYRSRGLYVFPNYRNQGIAKNLLLASIEQGINSKAKLVWSYPKQSAIKAYQSAGFILSSEWEQSELGLNAYVRRDL